MNLNRQRVLVTGASGFLGQNLCRRLLAMGAEVHGTSRRHRSSHGIVWHQTEWSDATQARQTIAAVRPDVVVNLAGHVSASPDFSLITPTFDSHLSATVNLLAVSTKCDVRRVIIVGSTEEPLTLSQPPASPYGAAKAAGSIYCKMFHDLYRTPVVLIRPSMTFGPHQSVDKILPYVIRCAIEGRSPHLSSGARRADWIYVDDVIDGFVAAATTPGVECQTFELGSGLLRTTRSLVEDLLLQLGCSVTPVFGAIPDRPGEAPRAAMTDAAAQRLGWSVKTPMAEALRRTAAWYIEHFETDAGKQMKILEQFCL